MTKDHAVQFSTEYPEFQEKRFIICVDRRHAVVYLAESRTIQKHSVIETPDTQYEYSDKEGFSVAPSGATFGAGQEEHNKEHYEKVFLNYFAEELKKLEQEEKIGLYHFFMPHEISNSVKGKIPKTILEHAIFHDGNLMKAEPLELIRRIFKRD